MATNSHNTSRMVSLSRRGMTNMEAFDKLPAAIRRALANSDHNWSAANAYDAHRSRKRACFDEAEFELSKASAWQAFIAYQDARKHHLDAAADPFICPDQR